MYQLFILFINIMVNPSYWYDKHNGQYEDAQTEKVSQLTNFQPS